MFERFTERARRTLVLAQDEARQLGHGSIGPEHLLLGVARDGDALGESLKAHGLGVGALRSAIGTGDDPLGPEPGTRPFTPSAKRALEMALRRALQLGDDDVGKVHLLLGIADLADDEGLAPLEALGSDGDALRKLALDARGGSEPVGHGHEGGEAAERPARSRGRSSGATGTEAVTPYCPWCDSPFKARWWWQKAVAASGGRELGVVVVGCSSCGTVTSVVPPPSAS